jgi:hypothetical protein
MNALSALLIAATMTVFAGSAVNADIVYLNKIVGRTGWGFGDAQQSLTIQESGQNTAELCALETSVAPLALYLGLVTPRFSKETVPRTQATTK